MLNHSIHHRWQEQLLVLSLLLVPMLSIPSDITAEPSRLDDAVTRVSADSGVATDVVLDLEIYAAWAKPSIGGSPRERFGCAEAGKEPSSYKDVPR